MGPRFTIRAILLVTAYVGMIIAACSHSSPVWRLALLYAIVAFTPGVFGPMVAREFRRPR